MFWFFYLHLSTLEAFYNQQKHEKNYEASQRYAQFLPKSDRIGPIIDEVYR